MSRRHCAAGVITGRRRRVLFEINEAGDRIMVDPAEFERQLADARAKRRVLFAREAPRRAAASALAAHSD